VTRLVLFDIDGTLVLTGGAGGRAMARAFEDLFGVADAFAGIPMPGRTDSWILTDAAAVHRIPPTELSRFPAQYLAHLKTELDRPLESLRSLSGGLPRKGVMPGVRPLLDALSARSDVYLALLTGNYEEAARVKLEYFDLWRYFRCGAFGDDAPDRNGLLPKALGIVRACGGPEVTAEETVVVGDTPLDVACAAAAGARSIAVATGGYNVDALREAGADIAFEDLSDTDSVLRALL
jgi:phosphoglycolate phosphatase-like HAD superfamily hydrolase